VHLLRQNGTEMYNPSGIGMIMAPDGDANTLEFEPAGIFSRLVWALKYADIGQTQNGNCRLFAQFASKLK